jgi:hypothetical protein
MIQHRGQAFYDVEPRPIEKLRVETPFMVAVVKGTQFSVAIDDGQTTISLFEGLLELRSIDEQQILEISAGEIAVGSLTSGIRVLPMDADLFEESVAAAIGAGAQQEGSTVAAIRAVGETTDVSVPGSVLEVDIGDDPVIDTLTARVDTGIAAGLSIGAPQAPLAGGAGVDVGIDTSVDLDADLGGGDVSVGLDAGLDLGGDLGGTGVDVGLDTGLDVGLDGGLDIAAELEVGLDLDAALDPLLDLGEDTDSGADSGDSEDSDTGSLLDDLLPSLL